MTHRNSIRLPGAVTLPAAPFTGAAELRTALGASRAVISLWRRNHQFPGFTRQGHDCLVSTAEMVSWLEARGVRVTRAATPVPAPPQPPHEAREATI